MKAKLHVLAVLVWKRFLETDYKLFVAESPEERLAEPDFDKSINHLKII